MNKIYFTDMHTNHGNTMENKVKKLLKKLNINEFIKPGELVAVKLHVGERGNLGYIPHNYARAVVDMIKEAGGTPYLTDTNTLYSGGRHTGVAHMITAIQHGFTYESTGAVFLPADGVRGLDFIEVEINQKHIKKAKLAAGILKADKIIFISHFKGHMEAGFGGSIKNMAMGVAAIPGKMEQHSTAQPNMDQEKCVGCRQCERTCPVGAIYMENKKAVIDYKKCIGCGQCIAACNYGAITPNWGSTHSDFIEKIAEYALAVDKHFGENALYLNFAINITPDCDCWGYNEVPLVSDVGIFAGKNPVALDRASLEQVNRSIRNSQSKYYDKTKESSDLFESVYPGFHSNEIFEYLESMGLTSQYELVNL